MAAEESEGKVKSTGDRPDTLVPSAVRARARGYSETDTVRTEVASGPALHEHEPATHVRTTNAGVRAQIVVAAVWARCQTEALAKGRVALRRYDQRTPVVEDIVSIESLPTDRRWSLDYPNDRLPAAVPFGTHLGTRLLDTVDIQRRAGCKGTDQGHRGRHRVPPQCDEWGTPIHDPLGSSTVSDRRGRSRWLVPGVATLSNCQGR